MRKMLLVSVISLAVMAAATGARAAEKFPMLWLNQSAPAFSLNDSNGKKISLSDFKGKNTVVLAFWHPDSAFAVAQIQDLQKMLSGNKKLAGVKVLAITRGKEVAERDKAKKKFADLKIDFTLLFENREDNTSTNVSYQVWMLPSFIVVNKKGQIATPSVTTLSDDIAGRDYSDVLADIDAGKTTDGCMFAPVRDKADKDKAKVYGLIGKAAPAFNAPDASGVSQAPGFYKGFKNVVLVFWSPMCPHCRRELPQISEYYNKFASKQNVEILAIALGEDDKMKDASRDFFKQYGIKYPLVLNAGKKIDIPYNVNSVPTVIMIDKKGVVRDAYIGEVSMVADVLSCTVGKMK